MEIDINRKSLYKMNISKERTEKRLNEIKDLNFKEVGIAHFGIEGIVSGLYIERILNDSAPIWKDYIIWVKELIKTSANGS